MVRVRDTGPELALRRELHRRGLRYRVDAPLPGLPRRRADLLFSRSRVVVFIDGCFWHGCTLHRNIPEHNHDWWEAKITTNRDRDRSTDSALAVMGYQVLRFWEHDDMRCAADMVEGAVRGNASHRSLIADSVSVIIASTALMDGRPAEELGLLPLSGILDAKPKS
jgi:DNA mismatch endonuclease (patch repair protein)